MTAGNLHQEILRVSGIRKSFEGVHALSGANFSLRAGEVHALMGENGAGKSTLAKVIAGAVRADEGEIFIDGNPVRISGPEDSQALGISIIYQELDLFPHLTIAENLVIGNSRHPERGLVRFSELDRFARPYLQQVGLNISPRRLVGSLNTAEMQLVAIARALSMNSRIIIMDEPTSSLFNDSVDRLFQLIAGLRSRGVAVVYVSHKMDEIFRICDRITVMRDGSTIGTEPIEDITPTALIGMMVGREWVAGERRTRTLGEVLLSVSGLTTHKLRNVSFELRKGEVVGIAGLVGAGRSSLGAALMGVDRWQEGELTLRGKRVKPDSVPAAFQLGLRFLPEDRKLDGLMMQMSVLENSTIADLPRFSTAGFVHPTQEVASTEPLFRQLAIKAASLRASVDVLSGGNQQKVLLARCLLADPDILFLDDPTRGIDIGAKEDIYHIIDQLANEGRSVMFVSSELPELLRCCDRILVMREGEITASFNAPDVTQEKIMSAATNPVGSPGSTGGPRW